VHKVSDVRHIEVHTTEQLVPGTSRLEVEIDIAIKFRRTESSRMRNITVYDPQTRQFYLEGRIA
jgi:hypothetical protein